MKPNKERHWTVQVGTVWQTGLPHDVALYAGLLGRASANFIMPCPKGSIYRASMAPVWNCNYAVRSMLDLIVGQPRISAAAVAW